MRNAIHAAALRKRLLPLYVAIFLQGFVLWYATEKLFMTSIGFNGTSIGFMVALYSAVIIFTETPSGILADRWSRKGVVALAGLALTLSGLIGGFSNSVPVFLLSTCFWGMYFALYSGTYDSIIYDTLLEETGKTTAFEKQLGIMHFLDGTALILGSLLGGFIAQHFGLHQTYFYTIPIALLSSCALLVFREPKLHKSHVSAPIKEHIQETLSAVLKQAQLIPVLAALIIVAVFTYILLEFEQLWLIALSLPVLFYGPVNAIVLAGYGLGGGIGGRLQLHKKSVMAAMLAITMIATLGLAYARNIVVVVACIAVIIFALTAVTIAFTKQLHDSLPSKVRAGASSAVSSLGRIVIIPVVLLFGYVSNKTDIFHATWILIGLLFVASIFALKSHNASQA